jgi:hypothetical protein
MPKGIPYISSIGEKEENVIRTDVTRNMVKAMFMGVVLILVILMSGKIGYSNVTPPVQVRVSPINLDDGKVKYRYSVINNSAHAVVALRVGFDYQHGVPELSVLPLGWDFATGLPQGSVTSPPGWEPMIVTQEESNYHFLKWKSEGPASDIKTAQTLSGFSVTLPQADDRYETAHYDVILGDSTHVSAPLEEAPSDTTPPTLSVALTPNMLWPPDHKMVKITASISVSDDSDPNPLVRLVSVTCNEPIDMGQEVMGAEVGADTRIFYVRAERTGQSKEGRVYTATYSATDIYGNTSFAIATVTVPHDQKR